MTQIVLDENWRVESESKEVQHTGSVMKTILLNGNLANQTTLTEIRNRLWS